MRARFGSLTVLCGLAALALIAPASHSQTVLFSNLNEYADVSSGGSGLDFAAGFTTAGSNEDLYEVKIASSSGAPSATVELWSDSGDLPKSTLVGLNYAGVSGSVYTYTPAVGVLLSANTTYWIVQEVSPHWDIASTQTHTGAGSLASPNYTAYSDFGNTNWSPNVFTTQPFLFEVQVASNVPEPGAIALFTGCGTAAALILRRRRPR